MKNNETRKDKNVAFIITHSTTNTANANRLKCIIDGYIENDCDVTIFGFGKHSVEDYKDNNNVKIFSLFDSNNKYICFIVSLCRLLLKYNKFTYVFLPFTNPFLLLPFIILKRKTILIHERTELPSLAISGINLKLYLYLCRKIDVLLVISKALKQYFISMNVEEGKIIIFPMLVNPRRFEIKNSRKYDFDYLAYCGDMGSNKDGLMDLISSFNYFSTINDSFKLLLIGGTSNKNEYNKIRNYVDKLGLTDKVIFTGKVKAVEVPPLLSHSTVLLLARPNNEQASYGFPTKLGEYLATSKPVLVTNTSDISYYLEDEKTCFIVEPSKPKLFAQKLLSIVENYDNSLLVAKKGHKKIYTDFNYYKQCQLLIDSINKLFYD